MTVEDAVGLDAVVDLLGADVALADIYDGVTVHDLPATLGPG